MELSNRDVAFAAAIALLLVFFFAPVLPVTVQVGVAGYSFPLLQYRSLGCASLGIGLMYAPGPLGYQFCSPSTP